MNTQERIKILNRQLKDIQRSIPPKWENYHELKAISDALNSNNEYLKQSLINQYERTSAPIVKNK